MSIVINIAEGFELQSNKQLSKFINYLKRSEIN